MKILLAHGVLHGDALTITGKTVAETLSRSSRRAAQGSGRDSSLEQSPSRREGHLVILRAIWPPKAPSPKSPRMPKITGPARVFDSEEDLPGGHPRRKNQRRRRHRDPLRRPQGRARHARDARAHVRDYRRGPGRFGRPDHRRALFGRARTAWWSATSRRRPPSAARSRWSATAIPSPSTPKRASELHSPPRNSSSATPRGSARAALQFRRAGQVSPPGLQQQHRRRHRLDSA